VLYITPRYIPTISLKGIKFSKSFPKASFQSLLPILIIIYQAKCLRLKVHIFSNLIGRERITWKPRNSTVSWQQLRAVDNPLDITFMSFIHRWIIQSPSYEAKKYGRFPVLFVYFRTLYRIKYCMIEWNFWETVHFHGLSFPSAVNKC
jgi:hypothetical protein